MLPEKNRATEETPSNIKHATEMFYGEFGRVLYRSNEAMTGRIVFCCYPSSSHDIGVLIVDLATGDTWSNPGLNFYVEPLEEICLTRLP